MRDYYTGGKAGGKIWRYSVESWQHKYFEFWLSAQTTDTGYTCVPDKTARRVIPLSSLSQPSLIQQLQFELQFDGGINKYKTHIACTHFWISCSVCQYLTAQCTLAEQVYWYRTFQQQARAFHVKDKSAKEIHHKRTLSGKIKKSFLKNPTEWIINKQKNNQFKIRAFKQKAAASRGMDAVDGRRQRNVS